MGSAADEGRSRRRRRRRDEDEGGEEERGSRRRRRDEDEGAHEERGRRHRRRRQREEDEDDSSSRQSRRRRRRRRGQSEEEKGDDEQGVVYGPELPPRQDPVVLRSGIYQYLRAEGSRLSAGLADDVRDSGRARLEADGEAAKFNRIGTKAMANGLVVRDAFARGVRPDVAAERDFPYSCDKCRGSFFTATQLSDHLLDVHGDRRHPSLLKPRAAASLSEQLQLDAEDD